MKKISLFFTILILAVPCFSHATVSEHRIALVIGNGSYKFSPLANPVNDANDIARALSRCGFEVTKKTDCTRKEMRSAIRNFGDKIKKGGVGLFYYAGHGIQVKGENYLVPVGTTVDREYEVIDECISASSVLRSMDYAGNRLNIIILDACRDNPFKRSFRSSSLGLARMDAPTGSFLAYATSPGAVAIDGTGRNGLYTAKLLKHMETPNLPIEEVFKRVRVDVVSETNKQQVPWESSSLMGKFFFAGAERGITVREKTILEDTVKTGTVFISGSPEEAKVYLDGYYEGTMPCRITNIESGSHKVKVKKQGYKDWEKKIRVTKGHTVDVTVNLERQPVLSEKNFINSIIEMLTRRHHMDGKSRRGGGPSCK